MTALREDGISERLLREILKGAPLSERTAACLRNFLAREDPTSLSDFELYVEGPSILKNFSELERIVREIDDVVITTLRSFEENLTPRAAAGRSAAHHALLDEGLRKQGFASLEDFLQFLGRKSVLDGLVKSLPSPDIVVAVEPRIENGRIAKLSYQVPGRPPVDLDRAALLWGDSRLVGQIRTHLHETLFGGHAVIQWGDAPFRWRYSTVLWPPSIDSFLLVDTLRKWLQPEFNPQTLVDVGSGTGFLGIVLRWHWPTVRHIWFYDWLLTPLLYSAVNWALNEFRQCKTTDCEPHLRCGLRLQDLLTTKAAPFDVAVCNPPYLPMHGEHHSLSLQQTTSGTELLTDVIRSGSALARKVFLQYSELANAEVALVSAGAAQRPISDCIKVPFRIHKAINHPAYISFLESCGLEKEAEGYVHRLRAYEVAAG
jgi:hypothetical protein